MNTKSPHFIEALGREAERLLRAGPDHHRAVFTFQSISCVAVSNGVTFDVYDVDTNKVICRRAMVP